MPLPITRASLAGLNQRFFGAPPLEVLRFTAETFGERAALLSSMQRAGCALAHMADRAGLALDVLFVDTGVLHEETRATRDRLAATHPRLRVLTLSPRQTMAEQLAEHGPLYLSKAGQERCCELRKSAPLLATRGRYDALIGALRRSEGGRRGAVTTFDLDPELGALRVHPLAHTSDDELDAYIAAHDVVINPLHAMGFPTIGCFPCTTPVRPDEGARAGRWRHLADVTYCGLNPTDREDEASCIVLDERYRDALSPNQEVRQ